VAKQVSKNSTGKRVAKRPVVKVSASKGATVKKPVKVKASDKPQKTLRVTSGASSKSTSGNHKGRSGLVVPVKSKGPGTRISSPAAASGSGALAAKPIKSPLNRKEQEEFRQLLLAKRATLMGDVANMTDEALRKSRQSSTGDLSNMPIHMADLGSDNFEQEFTLGLIESEQVILREIDEALTRIENGSYGICTATGKPISKARLKAKPWAKYCIEYAQRLERRFR